MKKGMEKYQVYKKSKVYSNKPAMFVWTTCTKATYNKYPASKRRIEEFK